MNDVISLSTLAKEAESLGLISFRQVDRVKRGHPVWVMNPRTNRGQTMDIEQLQACVDQLYKEADQVAGC